MYTARNIKPGIIFQFAWRALLIFFLYNLLLVVLYEIYGHTVLGMPFAPVAVIGTAVAFMVGFKNNSSYERLWEGRRAWGSITNLSRTWGVFVTELMRDGTQGEAVEARRHRMMRRHLAYINALRAQLRRTVVWAEYENPLYVSIVDHETEFHKTTVKDTVAPYLTENELAELEGKSNWATQIMRMQGRDLGQAFDLGQISEYQHIEFARVLKDLYDQQGVCERLKSFPFPRQFAFFGRLFVWIFILFLPIGIIDDFAKQGPHMVWFTIPFCILISWIFYTMEVVGDTSENPFENGINDVPMTAICRNIEIDLLQMLDGEAVPPPVKAEHNILM